MMLLKRQDKKRSIYNTNFYIYEIMTLIMGIKAGELNGLIMENPLKISHLSK